MRPSATVSHVEWSACLCVGHAGEMQKCAKSADRDAVLGLTRVDPRNNYVVLDGVQIPPGKGRPFSHGFMSRGPIRMTNA